MMSTIYDVPAPAKVNLFLHVVGRRTDGYHLLQTAFQFIEMQDILHFERCANGCIDRELDLPGVAPAEDLTLRAAHALQKVTGVRDGVRIFLHKAIPIGGGLGGGSSDAASTLIALNRLWRCGLSRQALMRIGLTLGADVPIFIFGQSAFAEGIGEQLTALRLPTTAFVVAQPQVSVPTAKIFRAFDLTRNTFSIKITELISYSGLVAGYGANDLEAVVCRLYPKVEQTLQTMQEAVIRAQAHVSVGQGFDCAVRLSGSGSCVYTQCESLEKAELVKREIMATMHNAAAGSNMRNFRLLQTCLSLTEHPLRNWIID